MPQVAGSKVGSAPPIAAILATKSAGTLSSSRPRNSLIWLVKMITAMPEVKPVTTG